MSKKELLPCPFCGGKCYVAGREYPNGVIGYYVCCEECSTNSGAYLSETVAIDKWNRRTNDAKC